MQALQGNGDRLLGANMFSIHETGFRSNSRARFLWQLSFSWRKWTFAGISKSVFLTIRSIEFS